MVLAKFLDPKNDFCFRQIFGTEKNKDILVHFLNDVLKFEGSEQITNVEFLPTIKDPDIAAYRQSIIDVLCQDQDGNQVIVEMQVSKHKGFEKRALYYAAKAYSQQILEEDEEYKGMAVYAKLKGVIFLAIADFMMFSDKKHWKSKHRILDEESYANDLKDFYFVFLELVKFKKTIENLKTIEEKWMYFFKHAGDSTLTLTEIEHLIGKDEIIRRAFEAVDQASWSEEELRTYEKITKTRLDNLAVEQQKIEDAEARGEARGEAKGKAEGKAEEKVELAKKMLKEGYPIEGISKLTGLTLEKIKKLKEEMEKLREE
ncbi:MULTISPECIES: Rpn family recombination-promoting nuclease/putative transposase [Rickettsieae]|uniref:Rpn family recombination-promoting nuclease/putative transposase n=1 Tax=Rickettsieae TaxID=33988 RepID=UPI000B9A225E|nr:Rpn family recombination-promoting nuclease/putative transposase [Rickettsia endosymbiont of Culicoides newsteadi]OZG31507.1 transposase [Rickettsia endosymbiont of Culicoides newsteadi]